jgi:hypothetical protein
MEHADGRPGDNPGRPGTASRSVIAEVVFTRLAIG